MKKRQWSKLGSIFLATLLIAVSCSSGGDDSADTNQTAAETTRPAGWTEESHSKEAAPDYDVVFPEGVVNRIDLTIDSADWQAMMEDMTSLYGDFGSQSSITAQPVPGDTLPPIGNAPSLGGAPPNQTAQQPAAPLTTAAPAGDMLMSDTNPIWVPCTVTFNDMPWYHVGVRFKGNSSLRDTWQMGSYKLPFRFDFDQFEDDYPEIDDQRFYGFKKLSLSSNYHDDTFIREKVVADLFRDAGVPAPRTAFFRLYVDYGEGSVYFGLYTMVEIPDDPMLEAQFTGSSGNLYKPETSLETYDEESFDKETNEDEADYSDVLAFYNALHADRTIADTWRSGLESTLDVDGYLRWLAVNTLVQNWDTYGLMAHNFYLYNDPGDGRLHWIPWDNNEALGTQTRQPLTLSLENDEVGDAWPLIRYLMDDDEYRARYVAYVGQAATDVFQPDRMQAIYAEAHALVEPYTVGEYGEVSGYTLLRTPESFYTGLEYLNTHVEERYQAAMDFIAGQ